MKKLYILAALCLGVVGCSGGGSSPEPNASDSKTPTGDTAAAPKLTESNSLDVMVFKGGFGSDFYEKSATEYEKEHPGVKVTVTGDAHVWQLVQPRFLKGDPPDLTYPGWDLDHWALVAEGELLDLTPILKEPAYKSTTPWGDTFEESILKLGRFEGKQYVMPYFFSAMGWWYSPSLFKKHGWTVPKTYSELLALCEKIKAAGIAPITYQGQYPDYMIAGLLQPWIISQGGMQAFDDIQNLKPGAWKSPAVLKAAEMIAELKQKGDFQNGAAALSHTESQTQFITGKAAMIPCGTWLHSEMEKSLPPGFDMEFMLPPTVDGGVGDPTNLMIKIEPWMIPSKAKDQRHAVDFYKYLTSLDKAKQFVTEKGTFMAVKGANDVDVPNYLKSAQAAFKGSKSVWSASWAGWYRELYKSVEQNVTKLVGGDFTPQQFCDACESAAEATRNDPDILKHKVE